MFVEELYASMFTIDLLYQHAENKMITIACRAQFVVE